MNILHIITQKPNSTGSGIYMCGMINGFEKMGHSQAVIAGIDKNDSKEFINENISYYPVTYNTNNLNFNVVGMSDVMPYNSTRYKDMNDGMVKSLKNAFEEKIINVLDEFKPDLIICHHLYLLTSYVREIIKNIQVVGICHGTCLRQLQSHGLEREYIISNIKNLDTIFALNSEQKKDIIEIFKVEESKVVTIGSGFDENIFFNNKKYLSNEIINITYAGKISKAKGLESLIKAFDKLNYPKKFININIAGDGSDKDEYKNIKEIASKSQFNINFLGKISQRQLSELFRDSHIFVLPSFFEGLPLVVIESLACGCNVITTNIPGLKNWIGNDINRSNKIDYIDLPIMKDVGIPCEKQLPLFEERLANTLNNMIHNILKNNTRNKSVNMKDKTWNGLCDRLRLKEYNY